MIFVSRPSPLDRRDENSHPRIACPLAIYSRRGSRKFRRGRRKLIPATPTGPPALRSLRGRTALSRGKWPIGGISIPAMRTARPSGYNRCGPNLPREPVLGHAPPIIPPRTHLLHRRDVLRAAAWGCSAWASNDLLRGPRPHGAESRQRPASFGRAKSCILLFMWGGPAHQDTWDLKPGAPAEIRGEFKPIATKVPGIQICEHFPQLAQRTDKLAIVRSMTHTDVDHLTATHFLLTGQPPPTAPELARRLAAHRRGAVAAGSRARSAAAVRVAAAEARKRRAAIRRAKSRSVGRLAGPGVRSAVDRRQSGRARLSRRRLSTCRRRSRWRGSTAAGHLLADLNRQLRRAAATAAPATMDRHVAAGLRHSQLGHRQRRVRSDARAGRGARAVWAQPARPVGAASPAAGRAGRAAGDRVLAQRRHQERERLLGHAQSQFRRPARAVDAAGRSGLFGAARRSCTSAACWTRRWSCGPASSAARRASASATATPAPDATAAIIGPAASPRCWPAAAVRGGQVYGSSDRHAALSGLESRGAGRPGGHGLSPAGRRPSIWRCPMRRAARW